MEQSWRGKMRSKHRSKVRIRRENSVHDKYERSNDGPNDVFCVVWARFRHHCSPHCVFCRVQPICTIIYRLVHQENHFVPWPALGSPEEL